MSIKVAQNDFTRKMNDFDTLTKIYICIVSFGKDTNKDKRGPKLAI